MTPNELQQLLRDFYTERLALLQRHEASATFVSDYDINNAYQYVLNREEAHVSWVGHALLDVGAEIPADPPAPTVKPSAKGAAGMSEVAAEDARLQGAFVEKWSPRLAQMTHARHRNMLKVVLGEMLEQKRIFEQAAAGRTDLIGTPLPGTERRGVVLGARWLE
ncbi:MAG: hypothetical protein AB7O67_11875 [Vicinamibacterales bacterium]